MLPRSGAGFRWLLLASLEKTSFPSYFALERFYIPRKVAPYLSSQKSCQYTATTAVSSCSIRLQYHFRESSTISFPSWSVSISRALRRESRQCIDLATSNPSRGSISRVSLRSSTQTLESWTLTLGNFVSPLDYFYATLKEFTRRCNLKSPQCKSLRSHLRDTE